jgi:SHS2 domain-containing protein
MERARASWKSRDPAGVYAELEHPADLFLEIAGDDLPALFENALFALYDQVAVLAGFEPRSNLTIVVREPSAADALRALLVEALYRLETERFVAVEAEVTVQAAAGVGDLTVTARLWGEKADKLRHILMTEVKAVTYHQLTAARTSDGDWRATVLFDV